MKRLLKLLLGSTTLLLFSLLLSGGKQNISSIEHAYADIPGTGWINPDVQSGNCNSSAPGPASSNGDDGAAASAASGTGTGTGTGGS